MSQSVPHSELHLDDLDLKTLRSRVSEKWNTYPEDVLPAWVAEMDFPLASPIREILKNSLDREDLGYPIGCARPACRKSMPSECGNASPGKPSPAWRM